MDSAELKGPRTLSRIQPEIFDFDSDLGPKLGQIKTKISGTVPTNRHTQIPVWMPPDHTYVYGLVSSTALNPMDSYGFDDDYFAHAGVGSFSKRCD